MTPRAGGRGRPRAPAAEGRAYDDFHFIVFRVARYDDVAAQGRFGEPDLFPLLEPLDALERGAFRTRS